MEITEDTEISAFGIRHSAFGIRHSAFSIRHSAFGIDKHQRFGTSSAGLRLKKPTGTSLKPVVVALMMGHSSGRGTCVRPNVYHATTSVPSSERFFSVHAGNPSPGSL